MPPKRKYAVLPDELVGSGRAFMLVELARKRVKEVVKDKEPEKKGGGGGAGGVVAEKKKEPEKQSGTHAVYDMELEGGRRWVGWVPNDDTAAETRAHVLRRINDHIEGKRSLEGQEWIRRWKPTGKPPRVYLGCDEWKATVHTAKLMHELGFEMVRGIPCPELKLDAISAVAMKHLYRSANKLCQHCGSAAHWSVMCRHAGSHYRCDNCGDLGHVAGECTVAQTKQHIESGYHSMRRVW